MKHMLVDKLPSDKAYLHFEANRVGYDIQVDYELIIPLGKVDCRGTFDHKGGKRPKSWKMTWLDKNNNKRIPLGRTVVNSTNPDYPFNQVQGKMYLNIPFRDCAHAQWDNEKFGGVLNTFYSVGGKHYLIEKEAE